MKHPDMPAASTNVGVHFDGAGEVSACDTDAMQTSNGRVFGAVRMNATATLYFKSSNAALAFAELVKECAAKIEVVEAAAYQNELIAS